MYAQTRWESAKGTLKNLMVHGNSLPKLSKWPPKPPRRQSSRESSNNNKRRIKMKNTLASMSFITVMAFASMAMATTWTATDHANFNFGSGGTYQNTLDLAVDGFTPGIDTITSGLLALDFDNSGLITKIIFDTTIKTIQHLVFLGLGGNLTYQVSGSTLTDGRLDLTVSGQEGRLFRGLTLDTATLTAYGYDNPAPGPAPVPEPGTIMLLGAGFLGLAIYGKRRKNA